MKRIALVLLASFFIINPLYPQKKAFKKLYVEAESFFLYGDYINALPKYLELIEMEPLNANINYAIGLCYLNIPGNIDKSITYLERASTDVTPTYKEGSYKEKQAPEEAIFWLGTAYRLNDMLDKAIETYQKYRALLDVSEVYYIEFVDLQIKTCRNAKELKANPVEVKKEKLNTDINSTGDELNPVINRYENIFLFARKIKVQDPETGEDYFVANILQSFKEDGEWQEPRNITRRIGSDGYCYPTYISDDGRYLIVERDDYGVYNLYETKKIGAKWLEIEKMSRKINSRQNDKSGRLTRDGNTIYWASDRSDGFGGYDIYMSVKDEKGDWSDPINLGEQINTPFNEESPIFDQDNKLLYFSSQGHHSMGGYDIFMAKLQDDGKWSEPLNIGYPANTLGDDLGYFPLNNEYAYYATFTDMVNSTKDIYKLKVQPLFEDEPLAEEQKVDNTVDDIAASKTDTLEETPVVAEYTEPDKTEEEKETSEVEVSTSKSGTVVYGIQEIAIQGKLNLQDNNVNFDNFTVKIKNTSSNKTMATIKPDANGSFSYMVNPGNYQLIFSGPGYEDNTSTVNIPADYNRKVAEVNVEMIPVEVSKGEYFVIKSVFFDYNDFSLSRNSKIELEKLSALMRKNPSLYLEVIGHTDSRGSTEYNLALSKRRARSVIDYIVDKGISSDRFVAKAVGEEGEIAMNENPDGTDNPEGRKYNRRVDIKIIRSNNDNIVTENVYVPEHLRLKSSLTYTILLVETNKKLDAAYFEKHKTGEFSNVWVFPTENGYVYSVGEFTKKSDALPLLNDAIDADFPDAKIINNLDLKKLEESGSESAVIAREKTKKMMESGDFTIQLLALKKPVELDYFKNLDGVKMHKGNDGYTRYTVGKYTGYKSAKQAIGNIIKLGYNDAFVVSMEKYQ